MYEINRKGQSQALEDTANSIGKFMQQKVDELQEKLSVAEGQRDEALAENKELKEKLFSMTSSAREYKQLWREAGEERNQLREKLAAMESQPPYRWLVGDRAWEGENIAKVRASAAASSFGERIEAIPVYAKPIPADKPAVAVPDEVIRTLTRIAKWHGEFPEGPPFQGKPQSYGAAYGSNGERDYMRGLAAEALELLRAPSHSQQSAEQIPECFKRLTNHAVGMCFGSDWNNGTAATIHRENLINSAWECDKYLSETKNEG